jgi:hypothetical protein
MRDPFPDKVSRGAAARNAETEKESSQRGRGLAPKYRHPSDRAASAFIENQGRGLSRGSAARRAEEEARAQRDEEIDAETGLPKSGPGTGRQLGGRNADGVAAQFTPASGSGGRAGLSLRGVGGVPFRVVRGDVDILSARPPDAAPDEPEDAHDPVEQALAGKTPPAPRKTTTLAAVEPAERPRATAAEPEAPLPEQPEGGGVLGKLLSLFKFGGK